mmetsp:Transcript_86735/g.258832  ORF Transcript_86735/g.258832 Transcript_86735/m.258832 type:complete len:248 (-) Transcript_86735:464-1207(-)
MQRSPGRGRSFPGPRTTTSRARWLSRSRSRSPTTPPRTSSAPSSSRSWSCRRVAQRSLEALPRTSARTCPTSSWRPWPGRPGASSIGRRGGRSPRRTAAPGWPGAPSTSSRGRRRCLRQHPSAAMWHRPAGMRRRRRRRRGETSSRRCRRGVEPPTGAGPGLCPAGSRRAGRRRRGAAERWRTWRTRGRGSTSWGSSGPCGGASSRRPRGRTWVGSQLHPAPPAAWSLRAAAPTSTRPTRTAAAGAS